MNSNNNIDEQLAHVNSIDTLYKNWFLEYASYVILERAIPLSSDGLKPVQRRILYSMNEMDDSRYHKVANIIGQTMQYHPHGDAGIFDALVNLGQKKLLIDTQGNWGDSRTGDKAAAARYIEARLNSFAKEILFNPKTTKSQLSYDGRKKEPIALPTKFPILLYHGTDGIAVGLSTKILPHNFIELVNASIKHLKGKDFCLYPDFQTGATIDVSEYNDGKRGGKITSRAKIEAKHKKLLVIKELPYGVTTSQLCDSIIKAHNNNKIKIKKVTDNTAKEVEIEIETNGNISCEKMIESLYVFTDCETKTSVNACVIVDDKPQFLSVKDLLKYSVSNTKKLLTQELEIEISELNENIFYSSLEKIFIEQKIYRDIEEQKTWEGILGAIHDGIAPHSHKFYREITKDDIIKLTEIKIKKISKYSSKLADEKIKELNEKLNIAQKNLANINHYTINYYENMLKKYGHSKERKTLLESFKHINVMEISVKNTNIYIDAKEGFIGTTLKQHQLLCECSDIDEIIAFTKHGTFKVFKVQEKVFVGKNIIHANIFKKNDNTTVYNYIYYHDLQSMTYAKRFNITGLTRDKLYSLCPNAKNPKVLYLSEKPNGETEKVNILLNPNSKARKKTFLFDFSKQNIKNRTSIGNQVTKYAIKKITRQ